MNRPYEENTGIVSNVAMGGILTGGAYTGYKVYTEPEGWLSDKLTKVKNRVYPVTSDKRSALQTRISDTSEAIAKGLAKARVVQQATYKDRYDSKVKKINEIENAGVSTTGINLPNMSFTGINDVHDFSHIKINNFSELGEDGNLLLGRLNQLGYKVGAGDFKFNGTFLNLKLGETDVEIPWAKFDEKTGAQIVKRGDATHYVAPYFRSNIAKEGKFVGSEFMSFNSFILDSLSSEEKALVTANMNNPRNIRDLMEARKTGGLTGTKISAAIESLRTKISAEQVVSEFNTSHSLRTMFQRVSQTLRYVEGNDLGKIQRVGRTVENNPYGLYDLERNGFDGAMESQLSLNRLDMVDSKTIEAMAGANRVARGSSENKFIGIPKDIQAQMQRHIAYNNSQSQSALFTSTFFPAMTKGNGVDTLKSIKDYTFNSRFSEEIDKRMPLVWNKSAAALNPLTYGSLENKGYVTLHGILDNRTTEAIEINPLLSDNMKVRRSIELKAKEGYTWKGLPTEKQMVKNLNPTYSIGGKKYDDMTLFDLYNSEKINEIDKIFISPGTIIGRESSNSQIYNKSSYEEAMKYENGFSSTKTAVVQEKEDILRTIKGFKARGEGEYVFFGQSVEPLTKVGLYHTSRSAAQLIPESRMKSFGGLNPEFTVSLDMFEKVFATDLGDGKAMGSKGLGELLTTMQSMVVGHAAHGGDTILDEGLTKSVSNLLVNKNGFNGNLTKAVKNGLLQFDQSAGEMTDQLDLMTRILGQQRSQYGNSVKRISSGVNLDTAREKVMKDLRGYDLDKIGDHIPLDERTNPFHIASTLFPHESLYTQGIGHNTFRMGINDMPYLLPPAMMEELASSSIVDSQKIMAEGQMYMNFKKDKSLLSSMEEAGIDVLDDSGINKMLADGSIMKSSHISDPWLITESFLNPEVNPKGFGVKVEDGRTAMFGSGDFYAKAQYLPDEERLAVEGGIRKEVQLLANTLGNGGTMSTKDYEKLIDIRLASNTTSKEGWQRRAALQIEGSSLDKLFSDTGLINNKAMRAKVEGHGEIEELFGNMTVVDKHTFRSNIFDELQKAEIVSKSTGDSTSKVLENRFGKGNMFEDMYGMIGEHGIAATADEMTKRSVEGYKNIGSHIMGGNLDEAARIIKEEGVASMSARAPYIYSSSKAGSFAFATDDGFIKGGKSAAFGYKIQVLENADTDGDIASIKFFYGKQTREAVYKRILEEQKISYSLLNTIKKDKGTVLGSIFGEAGSKFYLPGRDHLGQVSKAMEFGEEESVMAAFLTKATTGSAHVRTREFSSALMERIIGDKTLNHKEMTEAIISAVDIPAKNIEQGAISGKHVEKMLDDTTRKIQHMVRNMGSMDKGQVLERFNALSGDVGALQFHNILRGVQNKTKEPIDFLTKNHPNSIVEELNTLVNVSNVFHRESESSVAKALSILPGWNQDRASTAAKNYAEKTKDIVFTNETSAFKKMGFEGKGYLDFHQEISKSVNYVGTDSLEGLYSHAIKSANINKTDVNDEMFKLIQENTNLVKSAGLDSILPTGLQSGITKGVEKREFFGAEQMRNFIGKITPTKAAGALGIGLIAMTAMNLLGGDGTPEDINELPSVSNPSFGGGQRGSIASPRMMKGSMSNNMSMGLLTDRRADYNETMQSISAMFGGRLNNNVSVRSDGTDPYKSDMYQYRG